jgi:hypothetical protein
MCSSFTSPQVDELLAYAGGRVYPAVIRGTSTMHRRFCLAFLLGSACASACGGRVVGDSPTDITGAGGTAGGGAAATGGTASGGVSAAGATSCVGELAPDTSRTVVAVFNESASTNADAYVFSLNSDGSAVGSPVLTTRDVDFTKQLCILPPGTAEALACIDSLRQVGDVSSIPIEYDCPKSVSFGTETTVTCDGHTSGDLQCVFDTRYAGVLRDCGRFIGG